MKMIFPLLMVAALAGCMGAAEPADLAVASYPAAFLAESLAGNDLVIVDLGTGGAVHDFEPSARDISQLRRTTHLVLWDEGLETWAHQAEGSLGDKAPAVVELTSLPAGEAFIPLDDATGHDDHGHDELDHDPHTWNDPLAMRASLGTLTDYLVEAYPGNASAIQARSDALASSLDELHDDFVAGLADCTRHTIVTNHEAHNYLARRYGFDLVALHGIAPGSEPSPADIDHAIETIKELGLPSIFIEEGADPAALRAIQDETGVEVRVLTTNEARPDTGDYIDAQRQNLDELRFALGCT